MSSIENESRYAPPRAAVDDVPEATDGLVLATRGRRFVASLVDVLVSFAMAGVASALGVWKPWVDPNPDLMRFQFVNVAWSFALFVAAHGYLLHKHGQTIGKRLLGMRIVRPDGSAASFQRLVGVRYGLLNVINIVPAAGMLFGLIDALCIFRNSRRCLHDDIASTIVIKA